MGVRKSPDDLTSEALGEDIVQWTNELVARAGGEDERSIKLDRFMNKGADGARERIFYEIYKVELSVTATELIRRLKMSRRTVYHTLRRLTDEGWLKEKIVDGVSRWQLA